MNTSKYYNPNCSYIKFLFNYINNIYPQRRNTTQNHILVIDLNSLHKKTFLLVTFPAQGHVNPSLHFARRLIKLTNARVTFATCLSFFHCSTNPNPNPNNNSNNLSFLTFSDGFDDGVISNADDVQKRLLNLKRNGIKTLSKFIEENQNKDSKVTCLIYTILPNWVPKIAIRFQIPYALLWIQPALVFHVYYNHINRNSGLNLPKFEIRDLPSFISPFNTNKSAQSVYQELMEFLEEQETSKILVNSFDTLELEALTANQNIEMVTVGPLLPSEIFKESVKGLSKDEESYKLWLDSKTEYSVIYISFGTMVELSKNQIEELSKALIEFKRPFLWVITEKLNREAKAKGEDETEIEKIYSFRQELEEFGMIVSWCSQIEVLRHRSIGCFLTHCGWSSTLENLVIGVPVVAFPLWSDQPTIAKLMEEKWKIGVRVRENDEGFVERGEIRKCLEEVMGEKAEEFKENVEKLKRLAVEAGGEGGSSDKNIEAFVKSLF